MSREDIHDAHLVSDLGAARLLRLGLDQGKAKDKDQEERQENVAEIHAC